MLPLRLLFALFAIFYGVSGQGNCGAPQCYYPCTDARPQVDIVFLIDVSGSMQPKIQGVASGLNSFVSGLNAGQINPAFAVVLFGDQNNPDAVLTFPLSTSSSSFQTYMTNLGKSYPQGSIEPGLEALNMVMNNAASGNLNIAYRNSANSKKVFILLTNEDADMASAYSANLFSPQNWNQYSNDYYCNNVNYNIPRGYHSLTSVWSQGWQAEVNSVVKSIISYNANLYMFVAGAASLQQGGGTPSFYQTCNTVYQYCNPDIQVQNADYSGFNSASTLANIQANQSSNSLQGQLLAAGMIARCFDVQDTVSADAQTLINNFFSQITADLGKCDTKCYNYTCATATTCNPPVLKCDCFGIPFTQGGTGTLDKNGVCCNASLHDLNNVCCTGTLNACNVCSVNPGGVYSCLSDCNGTPYLSSQSPPHVTDPCGNCVLASLGRSPTCLSDCNGTPYTSGQTPPHFTDNCGHCVVAGSNPNGYKDYCGVCSGNNASIGPCGHCFEATGKDQCGQYVCKNLTCSIDCDGVARNPLTHHIDACGLCVLNSITNSPSCLQDCTGTYYNNATTVPPHHIDHCGNCILAAVANAPGCVQDCNGTWGGTAYKDNCGQCIVNNVIPNKCAQDCKGNYYIVGVQTPTYTYDDCGDCTTQANWDTKKDKCGICTNTPGYNSATQCTPDCKGIYSLVGSANRSFVDSCGDCWFSWQKNMSNYFMDDCGVCYSTRSDPGWNTESTGKDTQGNVCKCSTVPIPCPGGLATTCTDHCPAACANGSYDACGICPGSPGYNSTLDDCGVCITANHTKNSDKDSCGVCFGGNKGRLTNPCGLCVASQCHIDCNNKPNGTDVYDACGVCAGDNSTCNICGDGKKTGTEQCDLGPQNGVPGSGCTKDCVSTIANDTGAIAGGVIGAIVGVIVLGLAAFFALQYAKKNGLIGNANKSVDMGASNSNPLYQNQVKVSSNPLYGAS